MRTSVIVSGGFGTRISSKYPDIPKALVPLLGKPILERQIEALKGEGICEFFLVVGYKAEQIKAFIEGKQQFGAKIHYIEEREPLGTGGALYYLKTRIREDFLLCMGDVLFDMDLSRFARFHAERSAEVSLAVHPNSHPHDSDLVELDRNERVIGLIHKEAKRPLLYRNIVNSGVYTLSPRILDRLESPVFLDLLKDLILPFAEQRGAVYGYRTPEFIKDVGTPTRVDEGVVALRNGIVSQRNLRNKQKAVFLDRDGCLNVHKGYISHHEDLELEKGAAEAVGLINSSPYLAIVVTNQPVVARNECDFEALTDIHKKLDVLLGRDGVFVDDLFFCPHHPDGGYPGERKELKRPCDCRKPQIGLIERAARRYNIDLAQSWVVGDTTVDVQTGANAGTKTVLLETGIGGSDGKFDASPTFQSPSLLETVRQIVGNDLYP
jgi:histidinol-phosphate phosphatase family protein